MKLLVLIRHAKSSWNNASIPDFDRPLNARGTKDAGEMAERLLKKIAVIDAFIFSPALRTTTTAETFAQTFGANKNQLFPEQGLYLASPSFFNRFIETIDDKLSTVAVFSHNPGITEFANTLTTTVATDNIPTCGIFAVTSNADSWKHFLTAKKELVLYDYPKSGS